VVVGGLQALLSHETEGRAFLQALSASLNGASRPEGFGGCIRALHQLALFKNLGEDDVPAAHRHDDHDDQGAASDEVALGPQRFKAVRVVDDFLLHLGRRHGGGRWCRRIRRWRRGLGMGKLGQQAEGGAETNGGRHQGRTQEFKNRHVHSEKFQRKKKSRSLVGNSAGTSNQKTEISAAKGRCARPASLNPPDVFEIK
jgi:hypothetical protein